MPMGLKNAPAYFQSVMDKLFNCVDFKIRKNVINMQDDILIVTSTVEEHMMVLKAMFEKLKSVNMKLKVSKCEFFRKKVG